MAWYLTLPMLFAQAAAPQVVDDGSMTPTLKLVIALGVIVGSFVGGGVIARSLRMPDYSFKIGLVLFTLVASLAICFTGWPPKRGIDLSGGVVLVYEVDRGVSSSNAMQEAVTRVNDQLRSGGGERLEVRPNGADRLEVIVPAGADLPNIESEIGKVAAAPDLKLHASGKREEGGKTILEYQVDSKQKAIDMDKLVAAIGRRINPSGVKELTIRQYGAEQLQVIIPEIEDREVEQIKKRISTSGLLEFRIVANQVDDKDLIKVAERTPGRDVYVGGRLEGRWVKASPQLQLNDATIRDTPGRGREILVRIDPWNIDGSYLNRASNDFADGNLAVRFSLDTVGAEKFGQLTGHNLPDEAINFRRRLGIVLDNEMLSAPDIRSKIFGEGQITGNFSQEDVEFLVGVLNAGSLPATLRPEPISQQRISSQLGDDTIRMGTQSIIISTAAILIFMLVYYRFCGLVADIAVVLNMIVTVALMILIKAAFTLPGLAGLVLTVGMAVDANVLIYERMREETERGASLRMAIRNGFSRAMATIIDSHVTTLVSGVVLYMIGTDQIKGFAVTMIIGLMMSLFTAVFVARVLFDIAEKKRWITKLKMLHLIGHTNIDFIRWLVPAIAASVAIIVVGGIAAFARGKELLDIDFTGGSSVQVVFDEPRDIGEVRKAVAELEDVAVSSVGEGNIDFKVDTSEKDIKKVEQFLQDQFGKSLKTYSMSYGPLAMIEAKPDSESKTEGAAKDQKVAPPSEKKPPAETPAEPEKPATETEKPAAEPAKPAEEPKAETPAPAEEKQPEKAPESVSYRARRHSTVLQVAAADNETVGTLLALAQDAGKASEPAPEAKATETKTPEDAKPADEAAKQPAAETAPAADKAAPAAKGGSAAPAKNAAERPVDSRMIGGTRVELTFPEEISQAPLREMLEKEITALKLTEVEFELYNVEFQIGSDARYTNWTLETNLKAEQTETLLKAVHERLASTPVFPSSSQIGGKVAGDTQLMALYAILASMAIIVIYVWIRFQNVIFGLAAVLALAHDVLVTIAFLAMSYYLSPFLGFALVDPFKISLAVLAALLTIVGFSINDTIVVFDRIREVRGKSQELTPAMINLSVNATLSRTLLTSGTVFIASVILYFVGGPGIHAFAFSMVVGVIAGTYSSIYIAAPVLLWMKKPLSNAARYSGNLSSAKTAASRN